MSTIIRLFDLVTSDILTLVAACVLALAILGLLLVISWPSNDAATIAPSSRSNTARTLASAGTPALEIARRTGLSRDALALMLAAPSRASRQLSPLPAQTSLFRRHPGSQRRPARGAQITA